MKFAYVILAAILISGSLPALSASEKKITINVNNQTVDGYLNNSPIANQVYHMLPFRVSLVSMGVREKYGDLPQKVIGNGPAVKRFHQGDIGYWAPGNQIAFYYHDDGSDIPEPGVVIIGHFDQKGQSIVGESKSSNLYLTR